MLIAATATKQLRVTQSLSSGDALQTASSFTRLHSCSPVHPEVAITLTWTLKLKCKPRPFNSSLTGPGVLIIPESGSVWRGSLWQPVLALWGHMNIPQCHKESILNPFPWLCLTTLFTMLPPHSSVFYFSTLLSSLSEILWLFTIILLICVTYFIISFIRTQESRGPQMHLSHLLWYPGAWHSTTSSRCSEDACKASESISASLAAEEAKRREDKGKLWWDMVAPVVGTGVNMEVQAQISLILVSVAPGGNVDLRRFVVGWVPRDAASQLQTR